MSVIFSTEELRLSASSNNTIPDGVSLNQDTTDNKEERMRHEEEEKEKESLPHSRFDKKFQKLFNEREVAVTPFDQRECDRKISELLKEFRDFCVTKANILVKEWHLPEDKKTIKPSLKFEGIAGGKKFLDDENEGILFKFPNDNDDIYHDEYFAQKAAAGEIRSINTLLECRIPHLHTTLSMMVRVGGYAVFCTALAPICKKTLRYGTQDQGRNYLDENSGRESHIVSKIMEQVGLKLGLKKHRVLSSEKKEIKWLWTAGDVEGHCSPIDGLIYICDLARLLPPVPPRVGSPYNDILYRHFRPEFMRNRCVTNPLCADVCSRFDCPEDGPNTSTETSHFKSMITAYQLLCNNVIPELANYLSFSSVKDKIAHNFEFNESFELNLSTLCHEKGINLRELGRVRKCLLESSNDIIAKFVLYEMVIRTVKVQIRRNLLGKPLSEESKLVHSILSRLFSYHCTSEEIEKFWKDLSIAICEKYYSVMKPSQYIDFTIFIDHTLLLRNLNDLRNLLSGLSDNCASFVFLLRDRLNLIINDNINDEDYVTTLRQSLLCDDNTSSIRLDVSVKEVHVPPYGDLSELEKLYNDDITQRQQVLNCKYYEHSAFLPPFLNLLKLYIVWQGEETNADHFKSEGCLVAEKMLRLLDTLIERDSLTDLNPFQEIGNFYKHFGLFVKAENVFNRALTLCEKQGRNDTKTALFCNNIARVYYNQGRYIEALSLYQRAMNIKVKHFGPDHPDVATTCNNIAMVYNKQGRYEEALSLYQRSLNIREQHLGPDHPDVAMTCNNIAMVYYNQGRYEEALSLHQRSLNIREQHLGPDHPRVAMTCNNIAMVYYNQGRFEEALSLYQRSLNIREKLLGPDHPHVAMTCSNIALVYDNQGRYEEALSLYQRALNIKEKHLGHDHPSVATTCNNMAVVYDKQGRYEEALSLLQRTLNISEKHFGPDHPSVAITCDNIAMIHINQGKYIVRVNGLVLNHTDVATAYSHIAGEYDKEGRYKEALCFYQCAMNIYEKHLGPDHISVATTCNDIAAVYINQDRYEEAFPLYQRALNISEEHLGPNHPYVVTTRDNIATVYHKQGRYEEALSLYQLGLNISEEHLGPDHPAVASTCNNIAAVYYNQGRYKEALSLYHRALNIWEEHLGTDHPQAVSCRHSITIVRRMSI